MDTLGRTLKQTSTWILEAVFPTFCVSCKTKYRGWCCDTCWQKITFIKRLSCPSCHQDEIMGKFCNNCAPNKHLDGLWTSHYYSETTIKEMIHTLKYNGTRELAKPLGNLLTITLKIHSVPPTWHAVPKNDWIVTAVPLTKKRERQRGFNQAELIAQHVAERGGYQFEKVLKREHFKKTQIELSNEKRVSNVKNAFTVNNNHSVNNAAIIIVDDVYTTGSTLEECARVLKISGAKEVWGLTVARG